MAGGAEILLLLPELALLGLICLVLACDAYSKDPRRRWTFLLSLLSLAVTATLVVCLHPTQPVTAFHQHFVLDPLGSVLKIAVCGAAAVSFHCAYHYFREQETLRGEYFLLGLLAVLGMLIMSSAGSLLTVYLGLELMSLSLYAMVAVNRESGAAAEAAMKYFVLGALASGLLLYGVSMLYGAAGTLLLSELAAPLAGGPDALPVFGLAFIVAGVAFKLGVVPFHMWVPDVYEGAPAAVTQFLATAPKAAALALAVRLLVDGMTPLHADWQQMLTVLAVLSMAAGNIIALSQTNIKRMLAYSAIAHAGFLVLGLLPGAQTGHGHAYAGALFYALAYIIMSLGAFGFIVLFSRKGREADQLEDFQGLAERCPWFAFIMLLFMFSLAGIPPFLGFWAKWFVLWEVVAMGAAWLAVLAVVFSVIGAYYYLRVIKLMYFDPPATDADAAVAPAPARPLRLVVSINGLALLALGFAPDGLMRLCVRVLGL